ncbi:MAG: alpha/beta hydrolase [Actinomycetota bacterium]|nr:alpha/beta hydrolase [Actinomycetota bacterium]
MTVSRPPGRTTPQNLDDVVEAARIDVPLDGPASRELAPGTVRLYRLARYRFRLSTGEEVGVAIAGSGVPLVAVHGFAAEGLLYAQTLSRLVAMGFKVVALDTPGHGATSAGGPTARLEDYVGLLKRALDELGIRRAVLAGHSLGGRLVTQLAADHPTKAIAVVPIDAIIGDTWDAMVGMFRVVPATYAALAATLAADTVSTFPVLRNPGQAVRLARLALPTGADHVRRPWRMVGPALSIVRSRSSTELLDAVAAEKVPLFVVHGDRDVAVPVCTARDAAIRGDGDLVVVHGASHSWMLKDPETLPGVLADLLDDRLGDVLRGNLMAAGLDPDTAPRSLIERRLLGPNAAIRRMSPDDSVVTTRGRHHRPRYRWSLHCRPVGVRGANGEAPADVSMATAEG